MKIFNLLKGEDFKGLPNLEYRPDEKIKKVWNGTAVFDKYEFMSDCCMYMAFVTAEPVASSVDKVRTVLVFQNDKPLMFAYLLEWGAFNKFYLFQQIGSTPILRAQKADIKVKDVEYYRCVMCRLNDSSDMIISLCNDANHNKELWLRSDKGEETKLDFKGGSDKEVKDYLKKKGYSIKE